jgi:hypothetical protein
MWEMQRLMAQAVASPTRYERDRSTDWVNCAKLRLYVGKRNLL